MNPKTELSILQNKIHNDKIISDYELELSLAKLHDSFYGTNRAAFVYKPAVIKFTIK